MYARISDTDAAFYVSDASASMRFPHQPPLNLTKNESRIETGFSELR